MRITSLVVAVVAGLTIAVTGCGGTEPEQTPATEAGLVDEQAAQQNVSQQDITPLAICPLKWACDANGKYYSTQAQCTAACSGSTCYRDYACTGTCVCP